jgi:hypothetical protein
MRAAGDLFGLLVLGILGAVSACVSYTAAPQEVLDAAVAADAAQAIDAASADARSASCAKGEKSCNGTCQDVDNPTFGCDPLACGSCQLQNVDRHSCAQGSCRVATCLPGRFDCNGDPKDGCESVAPCGMPTCSGAICNGNCLVQSQLLSDPKNCGKCGYICDPGSMCKDAKCQGGAGCVPIPNGGTNAACGTDSCNAVSCAMGSGCIMGICQPCPVGSMSAPSNQAGCVPTGSCRPVGEFCKLEGDCCSGGCSKNQCCVPSGNAALSSSECCSGVNNKEVCQ